MMDVPVSADSSLLQLASTRHCSLTSRAMGVEEGEEEGRAKPYGNWLCHQPSAWGGTPAALAEHFTKLPSPSWLSSLNEWLARGSKTFPWHHYTLRLFRRQH